MMNRNIGFLLAGAFLLSLCACGQGAASTTSAATETEDKAETEAVTADATDDVAEESSVNVSEAVFCDFTYRIIQSKVTIESYNGSDATVTIPSEIEGFPVVAVGSNAFFDCDSLTGVVIPDGVSDIGTYAFADCSNMTSVEIPDSVTDFGADAFSGSPWFSALTDEFVIVGNNVLIEYNGDGGAVVIPDGVTNICSAFSSNCDSVTGVTIPDSVTRIGQSAFIGCYNLQSVVIPDGVTTIGMGAFSSCSGLTSVVIPGSVTTISSNAFADCDSLESLVIPDGVTMICATAFYRCRNLTSVIIPESVTTVGNAAFGETPWLDGQSDEFVVVGDGILIDYNGSGGAVVIPKGTKKLVDAFYGCDSMTSVTIPASVTVIDSYTFYECNNLSDVYYAGTETQWNAFKIGDTNDALTNSTVHYNS